ncbi:MAG: putative lipid II flippase FtsW [Christensenellaceae bacterium]|nr:putative lipid II flippase FtsW [Christensenellaceae bacterium]MDD6927645.1 putative lipid II flippase FtsW [bacterium]
MFKKKVLGNEKPRGSVVTVKNRLIERVNKRRGDITIPIVVAIISAFGAVAVYSAGSYTAKKNYSDEFFFLRKHILGVLLGLASMFFACLFDYRRTKKAGVPLVIVSAVLLSLVFVPGIGVESYGAKRWIGFGSFSFQPSEIAKFAFVFFTAGYFAKYPERVNTFKGILPVVAVGGAICLLVIAEPNMSVTMLIGGVMLGMLFFAGVPLRRIALFVVPLILAVPVLIVAEPYRLKRLSAFLDPWASPKGEGYQLIQSLYSLGSGGFFGVGLFNSRQKYLFLPFAESDFILSVIGEELGFVGVTAFLFLSLFLISRGILVAARAKDLYGSLLASGITLVYALQVIINALVVTGSIPPTGIPLPLVSSGNTSVIVFSSAFGVLYNISKNSI